MIRNKKSVIFHPTCTLYDTVYHSLNTLVTITIRCMFEYNSKMMPCKGLCCVPLQSRNRRKREKENMIEYCLRKLQYEVENQKTLLYFSFLNRQQ